MHFAILNRTGSLFAPAHKRFAYCDNFNWFIVEFELKKISFNVWLKWIEMENGTTPRICSLLFVQNKQMLWKCSTSFCTSFERSQNCLVLFVGYIMVYFHYFRKSSYSDVDGQVIDGAIIFVDWNSSEDCCWLHDCNSKRIHIRSYL